MNASETLPESLSLTETVGKESQPVGGYQALARRYRPQSLSSMVGQEVTVTILRRALKEKRLHHALLFTGMRGVGKTTLARIIARALNCENQAIDPCNRCDTCRAILRDSHLDVLEVDAASNSGVDKVRELIDVTRYCPSKAANLVFIIDEVHMLSRSAFNAMLKTLEEPPAHVYFFLATTEPEKIPATVSSRCLKLHLKRVGIPVMTDFLAKVCEQEGVTAKPQALQQLARTARGSVRDGLSLLDQVILSEDDEITLETVERVIGGTDKGAGYLILEACLSGNSREAIERAERLFDFGMLPLTLLEHLFESVWWLLRYKGSDKSIKWELGSELELQRIQELERQVSFSTLSTYWRMLQDGQQRIQDSHFADRALLVLLMELTRVIELPSLASLVPPSSKEEKLDIKKLQSVFPQSEVITQPTDADT